MLANTKELLKKAQRQKYAVGHFNINNLEIAQATVKAAENLKSPIILATSQGAIKYAGIDFLYQIAKLASNHTKIPIALHLDHGQDPQIITKAIQLGYSSVMIDVSHQPIEKNILLTKQIVCQAHKKNISVEAELGTIGGKEDNIKSKNILYTDPKAAQQFVKLTGCDFLAVAIGTSHGAYKFKGQAKLKIDLLKQIQKNTKIPLVLHGASSVPQPLIKLAKKYGAKLKGMKGLPDSQVRLAIKNGICKVNTDTDLRLAFTAAIRKQLKTTPQEFDPRKILTPAKNLITKVVEHRIKTFGSQNKA